MILIALIISSVMALIGARPSTIGPFNVISVPPNCPPGQEWINGQCRDVWRIKAILFPELLQEDTLNDIPMLDEAAVDFVESEKVSHICGNGLRLVDGICRDDSSLDQQDSIPNNVITVPPNCLPGQVYYNGQCRDAWLREARQSSLDTEIGNRPVFVLGTYQEKNIISVPNQCPLGYKPDALGICRKIF